MINHFILCLIFHIISYLILVLIYDINNKLHVFFLNIICSCVFIDWLIPRCLIEILKVKYPTYVVQNSPFLWRFLIISYSWAYIFQHLFIHYFSMHENMKNISISYFSKIPYFFWVPIYLDINWLNLIWIMTYDDH